MQNLVAMVVGVGSSLVASVVWLMALRRVRPRIEISPVICYEPVHEGILQYTVKLVNRSRRAAVGVHLELVVVEVEHTRGGPIMNRTYLDLMEPDPLVIRGAAKRVDPNSWNPSGYRIRTTAELRDLLSSDSSAKSLRVRIHAQHEVSGVGKVFERYYYHPSEFVPGRFARGNTFDVVPSPIVDSEREAELTGDCSSGSSKPA